MVGDTEAAMVELFSLDVDLYTVAYGVAFGSVCEDVDVLWIGWWVGA